MSHNERVKGIQVHRSIIYGSKARLLTPEERAKAPDQHTHRWTVFLTSATSLPPSSSSADPASLELDELPGGADDLSHMFKRVTFKLHETYSNPSRVFDKPPFQVTETGWGEFTVLIRIQFVPESGEKPITLTHPIKLHHWGPPIVAPPPPIAPAGEDLPGETQAEGSGGTAPEGQEEGSGEGGSMAETKTKKQDGQINTDEQQAKAEGEGNDSTDPKGIAEPSGDGETQTGETQTQTEETKPEAQQEEEEETIVLSHPSTAPLSIAAKYPVLSYQYDEIVFSDPPISFMSILNDNPPTPLPPKARRFRDQREEHTSTSNGGSSTKKARVSTSANPAIKAAENTGGEIDTLGGIPIGINGEPGSADIPLEYSLEMEKSEWNKLNDARVKVVEEMDRWRERLIAQEKEVGKLKLEMGISS